MRDEIDGRLWAAHGEQFSKSLHSGFVAVAGALVRLWAEAPGVRSDRPATRSRAGQA